MNAIKERILVARKLIEDGELSFWDYLMGTDRDRMEMLAKRYYVVADYVWEIARRQVTRGECEKLINDIGLATALHQATSVSMLEDFARAESRLAKSKVKDFKDHAIQRISLDIVTAAIDCVHGGTPEQKAQVFADYGFPGYDLRDGTIGSIVVVTSMTESASAGGEDGGSPPPTPSYKVWEPYADAGISTDGDLL